MGKKLGTFVYECGFLSDASIRFIQTDLLLLEEALSFCIGFL